MEREFLKEKVWAVVGVTPDPKKFGYRIYKKLKDHGYTVYAVNLRFGRYLLNLNQVSV